jgi:NADH dehydrogenase
VARVAAGGIGLAVRDVLVTDHELGGLMSELAWTDGPTTGETRFSDWLETEGGGLGLHYASEIRRHFH